MADSSAVLELRKGRVHWNQWVAEYRKKHGAKAKIDLTDLNFDRERINPERCDLVGADLTRVSAKNCRFQHADLQNACLDEASLREAVFNDANLAGASMRKADLNRSHWNNADLSGVDARNAKFEQASGSKTILAEANFEAAIFKNASFVEADAKKSVFKGVNLDDAKFEGCDLEGANFARASLLKTNFQRSKLNSSKFEEADLNSPQFTSVTELNETDFTSASLNSIQIQKASLKNAKFESSRLNNVKMNECNLTNASLINSLISGSSFDRSELRNTTFEASKFVACSFLKVEAVYSNFAGAYLEKAPFNGSNLAGANFKGAILYSSSFGECSLEDSVFVSAKFDTSTRFENARRSRGMKVDIFTLERLGDNFGGFTISQRREMDIEDDGLELQLEFSGFKKWIHWASILAFLAPYALFLIGAKTTSYVGYKVGFPYEMQEVDSIWQGLVKYFIYGGDPSGGEVNHLVWMVALVMLIYNAIRFVLFRKSMDLEHRKAISGISQEFYKSDVLFTILKMNDWWLKLTYGHLMFLIKWLPWVALASAAVHSIIYLLEPSPTRDELWEHIKTELRNADNE